MKKIITIILFLSSFLGFSQTIPFNQIQKCSPVGAGSVVVTGTNGALSYTNVFPVSAIPSLTYIPTNSAGTYTIGGLNAASSMLFKIGGTNKLTLQTNSLILGSGVDLNVPGNIIGGALITSGGLSSQFLKGDGSLDGTVYTPSVAGGYEPKLNGTGFVKSTGTVTTYDNSTYLTTSAASSSYVPVTQTLTINGITKTFTTTSLTYTIPALGVDTFKQFNFNRKFLRDWDGKIGLLKEGNTSIPTIAFAGDSWTGQGLFSTAITQQIRTVYPDGGVGLISNNSSAGFGTVGSDGLSATRAKTAGWVDVSKDAWHVSASISADSSSTLNDSLTFVAKATNFVIHYMQKPSGGSFVYRINGTGPTTVSTAGTYSAQFTALTATTEAQYTVSIKVSSIGNGVIISGIEANKNINGVRLHNLGLSGSTSADWVKQDSVQWKRTITQLAPNLVVICLGVNDCAQNFTPASYTVNLARITARIKSALPNVSILIFTPGDIGLVTTYPMSQYITASKTFALNNNYAFIDNYSLLGDYTTANARGLYTNTSHINVSGGDVLAQNFLDFIFNGQFQSYTTGLNSIVGVGSQANALSTATANVSNGYQALKANITGTGNVAVGYQAILAGDQSNNTAVGYQSLFSNTTGNGHTAIGNNALHFNTTGTGNVGVGMYSLYNNTTGSSNAVLGYGAMNNNKTGNFNVAIGPNAIYTGTAGSSNTGVGYGAMYSCISASSCVGIGNVALYNITTGIQNTAVGENALGHITTGGTNVGLGDGSLYTNTTGSGNICIGHYAGLWGKYFSNKGFIDNQNRTDSAGQWTKSLIMMDFASTAASQSVTINGHLKMLHIIGNTPTPTGTIGAGAGAGATFTLSSNTNDTDGLISITTAGTPTVSSIILTLTFSSAYGVAPNISLTPANAMTAALSGATQIYPSSSTTQLILNSGTVGLTTGTIYKWFFTVIQ